MFVKDNSIQSVIEYFKEQLGDVFSERELRQLTKQVCCSRLQLNIDDVFPPSNAQCSESDLLYFRSIVKRIQQGEPMQYVLGSTYFYNLELDVTPYVLIPRPETEELVDWIVQSYPNNSLQVIDIGSGSGCIALALQKARPNWNVEAVDISEDALNLIAKNASKNKLSIHLTNADARSSAMKTYFESYNIIVSNPPYIPIRDKSLMAKHVVDYEPELALFVTDDDPLIFYRQIALFARKKLVLGGALFFELNEDLAEETVRLLDGIGFSSIELKTDLQGKNRMLKAGL
jgi:release factor glutamine methyltransferase